MWQDALRSARTLIRGPGPSLRVKLVAATLCLLAAGAAGIVIAGGLALRGQLTRQADQQLRGYARHLASRPFLALGMSRQAPDAAGLADPVTGAFSIELRGTGGRLVLSAGPGTRPGRAVPAAFAPVPVRTGELLTVPAAGGGSCLVIAEPVRYVARRLVFGYGADDFSVTSGMRRGAAGTLVVGLHLAGIGRAVGRLTLTGLAVSGVVLVLAGCLAAGAIRVALRPLAHATRTADLVAAGDLAQRVRDRLGGGLAGSLNSALSQLEARFAASTAAEAAARSDTDRMSRNLASLAEGLRRPVSVLHALAGSWHRRGRRGAGDAGHALDQVIAEAGRAEALLDEADSALFTPPVHPGPTKRTEKRTEGVKRHCEP